MTRKQNYIELKKLLEIGISRDELVSKLMEIDSIYISYQYFFMSRGIEKYIMKLRFGEILE